MIGSRKRTPWDSSINAFQKRLDALAPDKDQVIGPTGDDSLTGEGGNSAGT